MFTRALLVGLLVLIGCEPASGVDGGLPDAGRLDDGIPDAGVDAGATDAGPTDAGETDAGEVDAGDVDAGETDAGEMDDAGVDAGLDLVNLELFEGQYQSVLDTSADAIDAGAVRPLATAANTSNYPLYIRYPGTGFRLVDPMGGAIVSTLSVACALDQTSVPCTANEIRALPPPAGVHDLTVVASHASGASASWDVRVIDVPEYRTSSTPQVSASAGRLTLGPGVTVWTNSQLTSVSVGAGSLLYIESPSSQLQTMTLEENAAVFVNAALNEPASSPAVITLRASARLYVFGAVQNVRFEAEPGAVIFFDSFFGGNTLAPHP